MLNSRIILNYDIMLMMKLFTDVYMNHSTDTLANINMTTGNSFNTFIQNACSGNIQFCID